MSAEIPERKASDPIEAMASALDEAGCLVVTDVLAQDTLDRIRSELAPYMDAASEGIEYQDPDSFYPGYTRRIVSIVERSPTARDVVAHPTSMALSDHHLGANCEHFRLHVTAALEVGPGARDQILHREEDPFDFFPVPRPNLVLASMWALSDFTVENGGTQLVPGSHRWESSRKAEPAEVARAAMPAGSVLYWLGGTLHGAGANLTKGDWRYGIILSYSAGWLRQEENQSLAITAKTAAQLSPELQQLVGRVPHGSLGIYDPRVNAP